eukprot:CAMPEP_0117769520 /NCGR_PEP_ID=MMETSP0947-20121206/23090_1 /TAXON_ID=44440 /ORGANISM="Chattonella subsalsa, Strain CCMP2191" /LENGTH=103 /DNA_ID=CAMNT_0005594049 /DNA_START=531 /DNA_END=842 /DNA_ORIENTATION=+
MEERYHFGASSQSVSLKMKITTCGRNSLRFLGLVLRGSDQEFLSTSSSYDYADGHGVMRSGGESSGPMTTCRIGANQAFEVQKVCVYVPVRELNQFMVPSNFV